MKRAGGLIFLKIAESLKYLSNDRKVARMEENRNISLSGTDKDSVITGKVKIAELHDFKGHPFKVEYDMKLFELSKSIEENGVLVPLIVRKNPYGVGYEIMSQKKDEKHLLKKNDPYLETREKEDEFCGRIEVFVVTNWETDMGKQN